MPLTSRALAKNTSEDEDRHQANELAAKDHLVDVHRGLPRHIAILDDPRPDRTCGHAETASGTSLPFVARALATSTAASYSRGRDHGQAVLLIRIPVDALHGDQVTHAVYQALELRR